MKRIRNVIVLAAAIAVIVAIALTVRRGGGRAPAVRTQRLALATFSVKLPESGVVMHPQTATIPALVAGNVGRIYVKAGDRVVAGELLATIDNPTIAYNAAGSRADYESAVANISAAKVQEQNARVGYQAAVDTNESALEEARRVYEADVTLFNEKAIPRNQLDADKAKLDQAQVAYDQALEQAKLGAISGYNGSSVQYAIAAARKSQILNAQNQQQLAFTRIAAPFDGTIQTVAAQPDEPLRSLQPGDAVTAGQAIFTIAGGAGYVVKAQIDEQDVIGVRLGQRANVSGQDFPGTTIPGRVARIAPVATKSTDASSTAKQVLATIALNSSPSYLKDGMTVDVDILTTDVPDAIVVANDAVVKRGARSYVYVVTGGVAHERPIGIGKVSDAQTWVASGLRPGDVIVTANVPGLSDGKRVTVLASPSPSPSAPGS